MKDSPELSLHEWAALRSELVWVYDKPVSEVPKFERVYRFRREAGQWAWFLRKGTLRFEHPAGNVLVKAGSWLLLPTGSAMQRFSKDAHLLSVHFHYRWPSGESFIQNDRPCVIPSERMPALESRARKLAALVERSFPSESHRIQSAQKTTAPLFVRLQVYFNAWLESWVELCLSEGLSWTRLRSRDDRILTAVRVLNEASLAEPFPRRRLLAQTKLSEVHLSRLFLYATGATPAKYWEKRRLATARDYLSTSLMPVKEISWRLGFRSDSHFATWFLGKTAQRPTEYRHKVASLPDGDKRG